MQFGGLILATIEKNLSESCCILADGTTTPRNLAVVAEDWMAMECRPTNGSIVFKWEVLQSTSRSLRGIFVNHDGIRGLTNQYSSRFGVDLDESCSGLVYTNATQLEDAGLYVCHIERSTEPSEFFSAHLIVLGKNKVSIQVRYRGHF